MTLTRPDESILDLTSTGLAINQVQSNLNITEADLYDYIDNRINIISTSSGLTIADSDLADYSKLIIHSDSRTGDKTYTLPTLADNIGKIIRVQASYSGGKITITREGSDTINFKEVSLTALYLQSSGDYLELMGKTEEWQVLDYKASYNTGWKYQTDFTDISPGSSEMDYDNMSGTFIVGEKITEATSGNTGIIQKDTGSTLTLKNVTGDGIWTNERQITGETSSATADVNEPAGSSVNQNTNILHDFDGIPYEYLKIRWMVYLSDSTLVCQVPLSSQSDNWGLSAWNITSKEMRIYTEGAIGYIRQSHVQQYMAAGAYFRYTKVIVEVL
jgi:hypothetical protein